MLAPSFKASAVHPGVWWLLGLALAITAGATTNPFYLLAQLAIICLVIIAAREDAPWSKSLNFYLILATAIVVIRVVFRIIFNLPDASSVTAINLPVLSIPTGLGSPVQFFGPVSLSSLTAATTDGLRLATIVMSVALANSLANPRKLLKSTPAALYEVATAVAVAINMAPQLIESLKRVKRARELRGSSRGLKALPGIVIPVLEDTIEQSLALAASMDSRGFGRRGKLSPAQIAVARWVSLLSILFAVFGVFFLLTLSRGELLAGGLLLASFLGILFSVHLNSKHSIRTRYKTHRYQLQDVVLLIISLGLATTAIGGWYR